MKRISTGIPGLDTVLDGGYPAGMPVVLTGGPGSGKTVLSLCFAHAGLEQEGSAVVVTCDERPGRLIEYMDRLGMEGRRHYEAGRLRIIDLRHRVDDQVTGPYELDVIELRVRQAQEATGAKRMVVDSLDNLQLGIEGGEVRPELWRLFEWFRDSGTTTLITMAADAPGTLLYRFEEYVADGAIHLSQQLNERLMTRYLRVVKMRGAIHGTNEYPFLLDSSGISLLPVTGTRLTASARNTRTSTGIKTLDGMMGGAGYLDGSALMISGSAGTGKSLLAAHILQATLTSGKKALYISLEESPEEILRNLTSAGVDLAPFVADDRLEMHSVRSVEMGLESHLIHISVLVERSGAEVIVMDPISGLADLGSPLQVKMMVVRFANRLKSLGVTMIFTELLSDAAPEASHMSISSLTDVWIKLRLVEQQKAFKRLIHVVKARGSASSSHVREFVITDAGFQIEEG